MALFVYFPVNLLPARLKPAQIGQAVGQGAQDLVVQRAGGLLAVARDKRDRVPLVQQRRRGFHLRAPDAQFAGDDCINIHYLPSFLLKANSFRMMNVTGMPTTAARI